MRSIVLIAHNLRSCHNVGSLLRTAEGLGVERVFLSGYTPYPHREGDVRLPHEARKVHAKISKTALGAEDTVAWSHEPDVFEVLTNLRHEGYQIYALEQSANATPLPSFTPSEKCVIVVGREVEGLETEVIQDCYGVVEIPMFGQKESFNVVQAAAMALYHCTFS